MEIKGLGPNSPFGALGTPMGPDIKSKCEVTLSLTPSDHSRAVGTKSGPPGPSEDLGGLQKGLSGPKRALLGPPVARKGPDIRSNFVLTMNLTQWGAVGTKSGPPRTSGAPKRAFETLKTIFMTFFYRFVENI